MSLDGLLPMLGVIANTLFVLAGFYIYTSLIRQIGARPPSEIAPTKQFGFPEVVCAVALMTWFLLNVVASILTPNHPMQIGTGDLVLNASVSIGLLLFLGIFLRFRGFDVSSLAGFSKPGFGRILSTGFILLLAAYPLIALTDALLQQFAGIGPSKQEIVELFSSSQTLGQRIMIIILAIAIAPIVEEFIFRFFFYGLIKRYFGRGTGLVVNSLLFATVHAHLPSFGPLFVLGCSFTIAYEWSGSILVSMAMHALFNSATLIALAFPQAIAQ
ncbi:MAG: CPBP family intramembrane glutamic endopeptidase [Verrucomicrobiota bacterium]